MAGRKESIGICFTQNLDYRQYLTESGVTAEQGNFIDSEGNVLGTHKGIFHYTVGQRRGLNLQANKPLFVNEIRADSNEIFLGGYNELYKTRIFLNNTKFLHADCMETNRI